MSLTASDVIIITVATILTLLTILLVIWESEKQMYLFGLRPSESTSTDIAGLMTLARGLSGNVEGIKYENVTRNILYDIAIKNKLVCVKSFARHTSTDCSSSALDIPASKELSISNASGFTFAMDKDYKNSINNMLLTKTGGI
jgi:hypothetical protein